MASHPHPAPVPTPRPVPVPTPHPDSGSAPRSIDDHLAAVRTRLTRLAPHAAARAVRDGALLVDTRYAALRDRDGTIPGAVIVERNELEWRLDPLGTHRIPQVTTHDRTLIIFCNEGYASSLAAYSLQSLGLLGATDLIGGFQSWRAAGLPVTPPNGEPTTPTPHVTGPVADGG